MNSKSGYSQPSHQIILPFMHANNSVLFSSHIVLLQQASYIVYSSLLAVLYLLICSELATSEVHYITPSSNVSCSCLTLSQFAANADNYLSSNPTLAFLPGNHFLHSRLNLINLLSFSMLSESSTATVKCQQSANYHFQSISRVYIKKLQICWMWG